MAAKKNNNIVLVTADETGSIEGKALISWT